MSRLVPWGSWKEWGEVRDALLSDLEEAQRLGIQRVCYSISECLLELGVAHQSLPLCPHS
jgi:hypothetical protein